MAAVIELPSCETCEHFAKKRSEDTPCGDCERLNCLPENEDAIDVFSQCMGHIRYSPDGKPLGIDYNAVEIVMKRKGVYFKNRCFEQVTILEREFILKDK